MSNSIFSKTNRTSRYNFSLSVASLATAFTILTPLPTIAETSEKRIIVGYVENVRVDEVDAVVKAKLDSGATTSSINANIIEQTDDYVVFEIDTETEDESAEKKKLKKKVQRIVRIKKKSGGADGEETTIRRPVINMEFCIAGQLIEGEVNLAERDRFTYDLLIGRNMLESGQLVIDVSKTFTGKPNCTEAG